MQSTHLKDPVPSASHDGAPPFRPAPDTLGRPPRNRAEATVELAVKICTAGAGYGHGGRGPVLFDDIGFVRACAQGAVDWDAERLNIEEPPALSDMFGFRPGHGDPNVLASLLLDWGLTQLPRGTHVSKDAIPGDLMLFMGRGPALGVVIAPWIQTERYPHFESPAVAYVWEGEPPRVSRDARMSWHPLTLFRWPNSDETGEPADGQ